MIENQNAAKAERTQRAAIIRESMADGDIETVRNRAAIKVHRILRDVKAYDPDAKTPDEAEAELRATVRTVSTTVTDIDAKIMEANGQVVHYRSAAQFMASPGVQRRLAEAKASGYLTRDETELAKHSLQVRMKARQLREGSDFEYGLYPDEANRSGRVFPISDIALPSLNSPQSKNALFVDYLDAHRKCWEAATFNPIAKRIVKIIPQFVLGRGARGSVDSTDHQKVWDAFVTRNKMRPRIKQGLRELVTYGEIFWRYFQTPAGLVVRAIDPSTIWDIVTEEDDIEAVRYYHQQYVRMDVSPVPGRLPIPSTMVIRQIPADQVAHWKINATSSEKRGRSELFSILGYLLRFKEFLDDRIKINKMRSMVALDVKVTGGPEDVQAAEQQFSTPPGSGSVFVHNEAIEVTFQNATVNAADALTDAETILKVIAIGAGVSENFLGVARAQSRAGALISTEPDVKNFEDYQELVEEILMDAADRVFAASKLSAKVMEFTFPAIAQEDRSAKLKDIAFSESMDYFTKARAATMAAREFQISDYEYKAEQQKIREERGEDPVISATLQQVAKIAPAEPGGDQPGLGADLLAPSKPGVTQTSGQMGFSAKQGKDGRNLSDTQATLNRPGFTRGGEKLAIQNNRTSGTPLRHAGGEPPRRGWTEEARAKSLAVRRQRAEARKRGEV